MRISHMLPILRHIVVLMLFFTASWLFYDPPLHWGQDTYFGYGQDPVSFAWFLNWWPFALTHHLNLLHTNYAEWPAGTDLAWKTCLPGLGLLAAPFTVRFGAAPVLNVLTLLAPVLLGWGVYLAAWELTSAFFAALLAGVLVAISGYETGQMLGHLNLAFTAALPLCIWVCLRAWHRQWPNWALALALGLLLAFEFGTSQEIYASAVLFGLVALALLWALHAPARPVLWRMAPGLAGGLVLSALLVAPLVWQMLRGWKAAHGNLIDPDEFGADLLNSVMPTPVSLWGGQHFMLTTLGFKGNFAEQGGYFSIPLLLLLAWAVGVAVWRGGAAMRLCGVMFLLALVASWGPHLHLYGKPVAPGPWLPFAHLPLLSAILPCRLALFGWLAAAFIVALWLSKGGWWRYGLVLACLFVLTPSKSYDRAWGRVLLPPVFAQVPDGAHVLVLPEFGMEMGYQRQSGMRFTLVGQGYLGTGYPAPFRDWSLFPALWQNQFDQIKPHDFAAYLAYWQVQYVVLLPFGYDYVGANSDQPATVAAARKLLAAAGWGTADGELYRPVAPPPADTDAFAMTQMVPPDPGAEMRHAHALRREVKNICVLRHVAARWHLSAPLLERVYASFTVTPLPMDSITCPPQ